MLSRRVPANREGSLKFMWKDLAQIMRRRADNDPTS
jgi:hypothetical protein